MFGKGAACQAQPLKSMGLCINQVIDSCVFHPLTSNLPPQKYYDSHWGLFTLHAGYCIQEASKLADAWTRKDSITWEAIKQVVYSCFYHPNLQNKMADTQVCSHGHNLTRHVTFGRQRWLIYGLMVDLYYYHLWHSKQHGGNNLTWYASFGRRCCLPTLPIEVNGTLP